LLEASERRKSEIRQKKEQFQEVNSKILDKLYGKSEMIEKTFHESMTDNIVRR